MAENIIDVNHASIRFNLGNIKVDNLKEFTIRKIRHEADVPVISDLPAALRLPAFHVPSGSPDPADGNDAAVRRAMLLQTVYASRILSLAVQNQTGRLPVSEYRRQPVIP